MHAPHEPPAAVAAGVGVVVHDRLVDPATAVVDLPRAVHRAGRVVGVEQVDRVGTDLQDRHADRGEGPFEVLAQRVPPGPVATDADVGHEQLDERVQVTCIDSDRVARREQADLVVCDESVERRWGRRGSVVAVHVSPAGPVPRARR